MNSCTFIFTCKRSLSSAPAKHENKLGANRAKKPSPRPVCGDPSTRLLTRSMAELAIHDSSFVAELIATVSGGKDCLTTVSYTMFVGEDARLVRISVRIEMNMGSLIMSKLLFNGKVKNYLCCFCPKLPKLHLLTTGLNRGSAIYPGRYLWQQPAFPKRARVCLQKSPVGMDPGPWLYEGRKE